MTNLNSISKIDLIDFLSQQNIEEFLLTIQKNNEVSTELLEMLSLNLSKFKKAYSYLGADIEHNIVPLCNSLDYHLGNKNSLSLIFSAIKYDSSWENVIFIFEKINKVTTIDILKNVSFNNISAAAAAISHFFRSILLLISDEEFKEILNSLS